MYISITSSQVTQETAAEVEKFLAAFLPKVKSLPGAVAIYHYARPERNDEATIIIWRGRESPMRYIERIGQRSNGF